MKKQKKSILVLAMILPPILLFLSVNVLGGESVVPPPPDKNKTLPVNDGEPDGCYSTRFKCVMGGEAVLDNQTGLIWARNDDIAKKPLPWKDAMDFCQKLEIGNRKGWRLPTKEEFISIMDTSRSNPALPDGHPFNYHGDAYKPGYWTSTTHENKSSSAYAVQFGYGSVRNYLKIFDYHVWPVLDGN